MKKKTLGALCINPLRVLQGLLPHSGPQVTMAMKTKKERFHVGALNRDLKGEMSRERRRRRRGGGYSKLLNFTSHTVGDKMH